jgi:hypothetical protein
MPIINILDSMPAWGIPNKYWYPIFLNTGYLKDSGFKFKFFTDITELLTDCDILFLSSRFFHLEAKNKLEKEALLEQIARLKENVGRLFWFDVRDSTGNTQFEVLPYVTKYLKKQLLKDKGLYGKKLYGNRLFTDFYHHRYSLTDSYEEDYCLLPHGASDKLDVSWNLGLSDFRSNTVMGKTKDIFFDYCEKLFKIEHLLPWADPDKPRQNNLMALFNTNYERNTVAFQRKHAIELLEASEIENSVFGNKRISKKQYNKLIQNSKVVLSLFGWGEICYRDLEAFVNGAALLMPDMSHIETWPNFYMPYKTYHPIKWDLSNMIDGYKKLIQDNEYRKNIAHMGQETYKAQWTKEGKKFFCTRLKMIIDGTTGELQTLS